MNNTITLNPISYIQGQINLPGSKSISNRVLLMAALSHGTTKIKNLLNSDDTNHMLQALKFLGVKYSFEQNNEYCLIQGCENFFQYHPKTTLFLGNAGTAVRPLTAILSLHNQEIIITGDKRMQERPIQDLVIALQHGGAKIKYISKKNYLPICIQGGFVGGEITVNGNISSQFLTSLLIAAPLAKQDTCIIINNTLVSKPYIDITLNIMKDFGIIIKNFNYKRFFIPGNQKYCSPGKYYVEGDASSATYFLAAAAIKGRSIRVTGINKSSIQGDIKFIDVLKTIGAKISWGVNFVECYQGNLNHMNIDANDIPDAAMTLAMIALFTDGSTKISNIYNWRVKETDRLYAMSTELKKIGAIIQEGIDFIKITPPKKFIHAKINTYNDHRIAMCFSLVALSNQSVTILNPTCVSKTFPNYFNELNKISVFNE